MAGRCHLRRPAAHSLCATIIGGHDRLFLEGGRTKWQGDEPTPPWFWGQFACPTAERRVTLSPLGGGSGGTRFVAAGVAQHVRMHLDGEPGGGSREPPKAE